MENNLEDLIKDTTESIMIAYKRGYEDGDRSMQKDFELQKDYPKMLKSFSEYTRNFKYVIDDYGNSFYSNGEYIYTDEQLIKEFMLKYGY